MKGFNKVGAGIYKKSNSISIEDCEYIYQYALQEANNPVEDVYKVPWDQDNKNVIYYNALKDRRLIEIINKYKAEMEQTLSEIHNEEIHAHLTTIVLWKPGQQMGRHVDDGSETDHKENLEMRTYTSVTYINDGFEGGETYIRSDGKTEPNYRTKYEYHYPNEAFPDFISKPEAGATVLFKADDTNAHGVAELKSGIRVILSTWYTNSSDSSIYEWIL